MSEKIPSACPFHRTAENISEICQRTFQRPDENGVQYRQFHRKTYACLKGKFVVEEVSDPALRHGLFSQPGSYPAAVRFSSSFFANDLLGDGRGMAIKLKGVEGEVCEDAPEGQQDFVLINQPVTPFADADEALCVFSALDGMKKVAPLKILAPKYLMSGNSPWSRRWHYLATSLDAGWRHLWCRDISRLTYYSGTPYQLGEGSAKYECRPDAITQDRFGGPGMDFRKRLQKVLNDGSIGFDFFLQLSVIEGECIDDSSIEWKSPSIKVGHLSIAKQDVMNTVEDGDQMAFSPWNCLREHTPLGSINEVRRLAYSNSAKNREGKAKFPEDFFEES
ncbi:MAG: hypothetical protein QM496_13555 [Verrucomicrobiota bacterium]